MTRWKRLFYYLTINVVVSACTVLVVLVLWEQTHQSPLGDLSSLLSAPSPTSALVQVITGTTPSPPDPPVPTQALAAYRVQSGDTLSEIAEKFDVSVRELLELNGMTDANALGAGQVLYVPAPIAPTTTPAPSATVDPRPVSSPVAPEHEPQVMIVNVYGAGDLATERIRLERRGEGDLLMANWQLVVGDGNIFQFPHLVLYAEGAVDIYTRVGANSVSALYWGLERAVLATGDSVTLLDVSGAVRSVFQVP